LLLFRLFLNHKRESFQKMKKYKPGVLFGEELEALYKDAKETGFALPAVNTIGTNTINATLETAAKVNSRLSYNFQMAAPSLLLVKACPMIICRQILLAVYPVPCTFIM
jgi:fructose/tagatose bisphosphate aldolase